MAIIFVNRVLFTIIVTGILFFLPQCGNQLFAQTSTLEFLPDTSLYEKYYADAIHHQFSLSKHLESREWFGNIGGIVPLADININEHPIQVSLGATVFNTIIKTPGHVQVFTVDYLVEAFADTKLNNELIGRFIWGHLSAHYSDDGITQLQFIPINYVRDYISIHAEFMIPSVNGKIYAGGLYIYHNEPDPDKRVTLQVGGDASYPFSTKLSAYGAIDIKTKAEAHFGTTQSFQIGIRFQSHKYSTAFRFAYTHRRGFEERGQLYNQYDIKNTAGIYLDF